jgi:OPA family glycerol-3-phosphate transporter-like MFS transporter
VKTIWRVASQLNKVDQLKRPSTKINQISTVPSRVIRIRTYYAHSSGQNQPSSRESDMPDQRTARWQKIILGTLFTGYAGYYICRSNLSVATPLLLKEFAGDLPTLGASTTGLLGSLGGQGPFLAASALFPGRAFAGLTKTDIGAMASLGVLMYAVGKVSNGLLADFLGGRLLFLLGMVVSVACTIVFGLADSLLVFTIIWAINRYVQSMGWGSLVKVVARWYPVSVHASIMGVLAVSYLLGDAFARYYLGSFMDHGVGWRGVFFVAAGTLGAIAFVSFFTLRSSPQDVGGQEPAANPSSVFGKEGGSPQPESLGRLLRPLLTSWVFWLVCVMNAGLTLIRETFNFWIPTYLTEVGHLTAGVAAEYSLLFPLIGAGSAFVAGVAADRVGGKRGGIMLPSLILLTGALWVLSAASLQGKPLLAIVLISAVSIFLMAPYSFLSGVLALDLGGKRGSSTAAGLIDSAGYLGALPSGWGIGALAEHYGWPTAFATLTVTAGLTALVGAVYWFLRDRPFRKRGAAMPVHDPSVGQAGKPDLQSGKQMVTRIIRLFQERGDAAYLGEPVSQTEHALQAAWAAEQAGAGSALITAALLHDLGHLLHDLGEDCAEEGIDDTHEERAAKMLRDWYGPEVTEPIRLHVAAKRFLCAREPGYFERLSEASIVSLKLQGGPFSQEQAQQFQQNLYAKSAVALRRWDEEAKIQGLSTPDLEHFRPYLEAALATHAL